VHQNCFTVQTGLQGILHDGQGIEVGKKKEQLSSECFCQQKKKMLKNMETFFLEGSQLFTEFCFLREGLGA